MLEIIKEKIKQALKAISSTLKGVDVSEKIALFATIVTFVLFLELCLKK